MQTEHRHSRDAWSTCSPRSQTRHDAIPKSAFLTDHDGVRCARMEHGPIAVRHVRDLALRDKQALEHLLGQPLTGDAQVFVTVVPLAVVRRVAKRERAWEAL